MAYEDQIFSFGQRSLGDTQKMSILLGEGPPGTFCNIRWDCQNGSPKLRCEPVPFHGREGLGYAIELKDQLVIALPDLQLSVVLSRISLYIIISLINIRMKC